jgi:hypothetical protein
MKKILLFTLIFFAGILTPESTKAQSQPISIEIPDVSIHNTNFKRKAELFTMTYNQAHKYLALSWVITYYADSSGHYGQPIDLNGISSYTKESIANNTVKVNPSTGAIVADGTPGAVGQYDFFYSMAEEMEINVHDLIRAYGAAVAEW